MKWLKRINQWGGIVLVVMGPIVFWAWDVSQDRKYHLEILQPIDLLENAPDHIATADRPETSRVIAKVLPGEPVVVRRMRYGKDYRIWKVRDKQGAEGWFMEGASVKDGPDVKVTGGPNSSLDRPVAK